MLRLPDNVPAVHLQFTEYYFPDSPNISGTTQLIYVLVYISDELVIWYLYFPLIVLQTCLNDDDNNDSNRITYTSSFLPVPTSNLYAQVNGLQFTVDPPSVLWISLFSRGLLQTLDQVKAFYHLQDSNKAEEHIDIRMDAAQLKVSVGRTQTFGGDIGFFVLM